MKIQQLMDLLSTQPPQNEIEFYCPIHKVHYYVKNYYLNSKILFIILTDDRPPKRKDYQSFFHFISFFNISSYEVKLHFNDQEFQIQ